MSVERKQRPDFLSQAVADWTRRQGGGALLAEWAARAAAADRAGNSAVRVPGPTADALSGDPLMQCADAPYVEDAGYFYLRRNHVHECGVAQAIRARLAASHCLAPVPAERLDALFGARTDAADGPQRAAVSAVRGKPLFVLTGGPGTGKTTTVLRMLVQLDHEYRTAHLRAPRIVCCAPTGKAAQRLGDALAAGAGALTAAGAAPDIVASLDNILSQRPGTVHRYLGELERDARLRSDIVVLDEASMLDLAMMHRLLASLDAETQLVLVGDANQLTSVETGSAFSDVVAVLHEAVSPALVQLVHSFRANVHLQAINHAAGAGDMTAFEAAISASSGKAARTAIDSVLALDRVLKPWAARLADTWAAAQAFDRLPVEPEAQARQIQDIHAALAQQQLLCAVHQGDFGTVRCNAVIETALRKRAGADADDAWYPGRAVLISKNDYALGLYNGDVGVCLADANGVLKVWFLRPETQAGSTPLGLATHALPAFTPAFAMSIHKSQGSEYAEVAVLLPADAQTELLSRQLLYTAVSRAKAQLQLWAGDAALETALATHVARVGALRARLTS